MKVSVANSMGMGRKWGSFHRMLTARDDDGGHNLLGQWLLPPSNTGGGCPFNAVTLV